MRSRRLPLAATTIGHRRCRQASITAWLRRSTPCSGAGSIRARSRRLTVDSGDTVSIETMMHSHDKVQPGLTIEQAVELRKANPGGGPHSMTGPIYVNGAEPGDVLEIRILRIEPKPWAVNFNLPGKDFPTIGALASEMPEGYIKFFPIDLREAKRRVQAGDHHRPAAVPRHARGRYRSRRSVSPQGRREGRQAGAGIDASSMEERLQHGHQRAAGGLHALYPGVPARVG